MEFLLIWCGCWVVSKTTTEIIKRSETLQNKIEKTAKFVDELCQAVRKA